MIESGAANQTMPIPSGRALTTADRIRAIVASSSGNLVEWYDFYTYAFTAIYFARAFFPEGDTTTELLQAAAIFAVGFLMRPIGSWFFGRYADRHGRKKSMVFAVLLMCAGSAMIAVLPTYAQAGVLAPVLLLVARMIQGFSVGGEYGTTATYMSEVAAESNRGFLSSFQYVTLVGGQLMASLVLVIHLQFLSKDQMQAWGWRIPFALGAVLAIVALYLRSSLHETADLSSHRKEAGAFAELLRYKKALLIVLGYTAGGSLAFYTFTTYMQKYLVNTAKFDKETATYVMTVVLFVYMIVQPLFGALSDRIGRRNNMFLFCLAGIAGTVPIMTAIGATKDPYVAFALATTALMGVSFYTSIAGIVKAELFPGHVRALGVGLSYAIANSIFGGSAEFVALKLKQMGLESSFFWYVTAMLVLALVATIAMPDNRKGSEMDGH